MLFVADTRQTGTPAVTFTQGHGLDGPWGMVAGKNQYQTSIAGRSATRQFPSNH